MEQKGRNDPNNGVQVYEETSRAAKKFNFWRGIYNKDKKYILGRTLRNWGELFIFYSIFYIILAALFAICMKGLMYSLDDKMPRWTLSESRIGDNPGLGFRPMPENISQGSLIWLDNKNASILKSYVESIDDFLSPYINATSSPHENSVVCGFNTPAPVGKVCRVSMAQFGRCTSMNLYGYNSSQPCIFLKLNRIFNWKPVPYKANEGITNGSYPNQMPADLKTYISSRPEEEKDQVFISCEGQYENDQQNVGKIKISPRGFPSYYYPYTNDRGYLSPLVSVQFESPKSGVVINVECIAWATNIIYHGGERDRQGSIHFELMIDN